MDNEVVELHYEDGSIAYTEPLTVEQMDAIEEFILSLNIAVNVKA